MHACRVCAIVVAPIISARRITIIPNIGGVIIIDLPLVVYEVIVVNRIV